MCQKGSISSCVAEIMKNWALICILLHYTAKHVLSQRRCNSTESVIDGTIGKTLRQGRVMVCDGTKWRVVCDNGWDDNEAKVLCKELGFPEDGASACSNSCYGVDMTVPGITRFRCSGDENRLTDCSYDVIPNNQRCNSFAGITCSGEVPTCGPVAVTDPCKCEDCPNTCALQTTPHATPPSCNCGVNTTLVTTPGANVNGAGNGIVSLTECPMRDVEDTNLIIISALGAVSALLLSILVGVVMAWVCSCRKSKSTVQISSTLGSIPNPSYNKVPIGTQPSIMYGAMGPQGTLSNHTPLQGEEERVYQVLDEPEGGTEGERIYHVLEGEGRDEGGERIYHEVQQKEGNVYHMPGEVGEGQNVGEMGVGQAVGEGLAYEAPVSTKNKTREVREGETEYSELQHN